jgi:hypothetical protein
MQEAARRARNQQRLTECFPTVAARFAAVIAEMEAQNFRPRIQDAHRTIAQQLADFNAGHSTVKFGFHNVTGANGKPESLAVDMLDDDHPVGPVPRRYLITLASVGKKHGLHSGIFFFKLEPPPGTREALQAAIDNLNFDPHIVMGFDPTHLEATGLTIAQAQAGQRPA